MIPRSSQRCYLKRSNIPKDVAFHAYLAGADSTVLAMGTFFFAMVCLPKHCDFSSLAYLSALVKEVYRYAAICFNVDCVSGWQPVTPLGVPHPSQPAMISTTTIISPPTPLSSLTNVDGNFPPLNIGLRLTLSIQKRTFSSSSAF